MIDKKTIESSIKSFQDNSTETDFYTGFTLIKDGEVLKEENSNKYINLASTSKPFLIYFLGVSLVKYNIEFQFKVSKKLVLELISRRKEYFFEKFKELDTWIKDQNMKFPEVYMDFNDLSTIVLKYSSNIGSIIAKDKLDEIYSDHKLIQEKFDKQCMAPTLELNKGGYEFWNQSGANTGKLKDIALSFDKLFKNEDMLSKSVTDSLEWGKSFGISNDLIKIEDIKMYSKDGIIWPVVWGDKLAKQGFPPHLSIGLLLTIKNKDSRYTLGYFKCCKVNLPKNIDFEKFPDEIKDKRYSLEISYIKQKYNIKIYNEVKSLLISEKVINRYKANVKNLLAMHLKLIYYYVRLKLNDLGI